MVWCDSGANIHSKREAVIDLDSDWGITDDDWKEMSDDDRWFAVEEWANQRLEIGWKYAVAEARNAYMHRHGNGVRLDKE